MRRRMNTHNTANLPPGSRAAPKTKQTKKKILTIPSFSAACTAILSRIAYRMLSIGAALPGSVVCVRVVALTQEDIPVPAPIPGPHV